MHNTCLHFVYHIPFISEMWETLENLDINTSNTVPILDLIDYFGNQADLIIIHLQRNSQLQSFQFLVLWPYIEITLDSFSNIYFTFFSNFSVICTLRAFLFEQR